MLASIILRIILPLIPCIAGSGVPLVVSPGLNVSTNSNTTAHLPPCTDLAGTKAPTIPCYNKLGVNSYFINYNLTSSEVCAPDQSLMGTCLLPTVYGTPGLNCTMVTATESTCSPFDCVNLTSTTCPAPTYNASAVGAQAWYAVYSVYQVRKFVHNWFIAVNATSSQKAITNVVNSKVPNTATTVMITLINKYGINPHADTALINMLQIPTKVPQTTFGNASVHGAKRNPSASKWQALLVARLQDTLDVVMDDFDAFLAGVGNGTFSTRGLASANDLKARMKKPRMRKASASKTASSLAHKTTASSHASAHVDATISSSSKGATAHTTVSVSTLSSQREATHTTLSAHSSASMLATTSMRRPVGLNTGP